MPTRPRIKCFHCAADFGAIGDLTRHNHTKHNIVQFTADFYRCHEASEHGVRCGAWRRKSETVTNKSKTRDPKGRIAGSLRKAREDSHKHVFTQDAKAHWVRQPEDDQQYAESFRMKRYTKGDNKVTKADATRARERAARYRNKLKIEKDLKDAKRAATMQGWMRAAHSEGELVTPAIQQPMHQDAAAYPRSQHQYEPSEQVDGMPLGQVPQQEMQYQYVPVPSEQMDGMPLGQAPQQEMQCEFCEFARSEQMDAMPPGQAPQQEIECLFCQFARSHQMDGMPLGQAPQQEMQYQYMPDEQMDGMPLGQAPQQEMQYQYVPGEQMYDMPLGQAPQQEMHYQYVPGEQMDGMPLGQAPQQEMHYQYVPRDGMPLEQAPQQEMHYQYVPVPSEQMDGMPLGQAPQQEMHYHNAPSEQIDGIPLVQAPQQEMQTNVQSTADEAQLHQQNFDASFELDPLLSQDQGNAPSGTNPELENHDWNAETPY